MAKLFLFTIALAVFALSFHLSLAETIPKFVVQGRVYCDNCRAGFETSATQYLEGAKVRLECRHFSNDSIAHSVEGVTNSTGYYNLHLDDDHQEEICEVVLVESPLSGCSEIKDDRDRARVMLSSDNGIHSQIRFANSLGFLKAEPLTICGQLLKLYDLNAENY